MDREQKPKEMKIEKMNGSMNLKHRDSQVLSRHRLICPPYLDFCAPHSDSSLGSEAHCVMSHPMRILEGGGCAIRRKSFVIV